MPVSKLIQKFPRTPLFPAPSPIQRFESLEKHLGIHHKIYCKRDDQLRFLFGNKIRYLEYILGAYHQQNADCIIHCGGQTSNYMAQLAMIGAAKNIPIHLILLGEEPSEPLCNPLISKLFGAQVQYRQGQLGISGTHFKKEWANTLRAQGKKPYVIDYPFSNFSAQISYMRMYLELRDQIQSGVMPKPNHIFMCSGWNSYLGLRAGADILGDDVQITTFPASRWTDGGLINIAPTRHKFMTLKIQELGAFLEHPLSTQCFSYDENYVGQGYGIPTEAAYEAMHLLAKTEGVLLDPVYTGKAMSGLMDYLKNGKIKPGATVLFLHSGGWPNTFTFANDINAYLSRTT